MRKLGVFTALALSGMTAACAERLASPAMIPEPASIQRPEFKSRNVVAPERSDKITPVDVRQ
jgi:hypothetical protein